MSSTYHTHPHIHTHTHTHTSTNTHTHTHTYIMGFHWSVFSFPLMIYDNGTPYPTFSESLWYIIALQDMHPYYMKKLWSPYFEPCIFYL